MGLPADTPPEDLLLLTVIVDANGRQLGVEPSKDVRNEYERTRRWVAEEVDARAKGNPHARTEPHA